MIILNKDTHAMQNRAVHDGVPSIMIPVES